jgi:hypothetical protein
VLFNSAALPRLKREITNYQTSGRKKRGDG